MKFSIFAVLLFIGSSFSIPVAEQQQPLEPKVQLRQEDGDDGDGVGEVELVGQQVSKIITGVLTGNFGQIFSGSSGFIEDSDTQQGVSTLLTSLSVPLNTALQQTVAQGAKYFNVTNAPEGLLPPTSPTPPTQAATFEAAPQNVQQQPGAVQRVPVRQPVGTIQRVPIRQQATVQRVPVRQQVSQPQVVQAQPAFASQPIVVESQPELPVVEFQPEPVDAQPEAPPEPENIPEPPEDPPATPKTVDDEDEDSDLNEVPDEEEDEENAEEEEDELRKLTKKTKNE